MRKRESPEEESARKKRQKFDKLESRVREKSGHESAQNTSGEDKPLKISPFRAINEGNGETREEYSEGDISPLYKESNPELYTEPRPGTPNQPHQGVDEQAEHSEEEEVEIEVNQDQTGKQVVDTREILSEPELDYDGSDYEDPRHQEPPIEIEGQIKTEPKDYSEEGTGYKESEYGYEHEQNQESGTEIENELTDPPTQKRVVQRNKDKPTRNMRRAKRKRINRDQATKSPLDRIDLSKSANRGANGRSRTPSSESRSEDNARSRANRRKHSPEEDEDETTREEDERQSNQDRRARKKDNRMPKNKNSRRH